MENIEKIFDFKSNVIILPNKENTKYSILGNLVPIYYLNRDGKRPGLRGIYNIIRGKAILTQQEFTEFLETIDYLQ